MDKIDFVLPWVDGSDPRWLAEKRSYENSGEAMARGDEDANADCRYRDYGLLRYWFRSVERFAPCGVSADVSVQYNRAEPSSDTRSFRTLRPFVPQ